MAKAIPVLRAFDYDKAIEFYIHWLGGHIVWEHRPADAPFYMQVSVQGVQINLSQHHGECSPGALVLVADVDDLVAYHQSLIDKNYPFMKPGLQQAEWDDNTTFMRVIDPFYNTLEFSSRSNK